MHLWLMPCFVCVRVFLKRNVMWKQMWKNAKCKNHLHKNKWVQTPLVCWDWRRGKGRKRGKIFLLLSREAAAHSLYCTVYVLSLIGKVTNTVWLQLVCVYVREIDHKRCCSLERASLTLHSSVTTGAQFAANWMKNKNWIEMGAGICMRKCTGNGYLKIKLGKSKSFRG